MTERVSLKPKKSASSGQHPAVKAYRKKLESIDEGCEAATHELDQKLQEFLNEMKTPIPPKPDQGQKGR